jgi:hypothetical protein
LKSSSNNLRWRVKDEIEDRRNRVRELQGSGYTITQIAQELQMSVITIKRDSAFLKQQARENYQRHIQERLPYDVENTLAFYRSIQKQAKEIAKNTDNDSVKVKALALAKDAGREAMDLELRGEYVKRAMDAAAEIQKRLNKLPYQQTSDEEEIAEQEELEQELEERQKEEEQEANYDPQKVF